MTSYIRFYFLLLSSIILTGICLTNSAETDITKHQRYDYYYDDTQSYITTDQEKLRDLNLRLLYANELIVTQSAQLPIVFGGIQDINGQTGTIQSFTVNYEGTSFTITSSDNVHYFSLPSANAQNVLQGTISYTQVVAYNDTYDFVMAGTSVSIAETLVLRDSVGSFSAESISSLGNFYGYLDGIADNALNAAVSYYVTGQFYGDMIGTQTNTSVAFIGNKSASDIGHAMNLALTATSSNIPLTLVLRDSTGSFTAENIAANKFFAINSTTATQGQILINNQTVFHIYGTNNTFLGSNSGNLTVIASALVGIGNNSLQNHSTGNNCIGIGDFSLANGSTLENHIGIGKNTLLNATPALATVANMAIGVNGLQGLTTGEGNLSIGNENAKFLQTGSFNLLIGHHIAKDTNFTIFNDNLCLGHYIMADCPTIVNCYDNMLIGNDVARKGLEGYGNTIIGHNSCSMNQLIGFENTAIGNNALQYLKTGTGNTAIGYRALQNLISGDNNVALGVDCLKSMTQGSQNTAAGAMALANLIAGNNNIALGYQAGFNYTFTESNNLLLGDLGQPGDQGVCRIKNIYTDTTASAATAFVSVNVTTSDIVRSFTSTLETKTLITDLPANAIAILDQLTPVSFEANSLVTDEGCKCHPHMGFIAEQVNTIAPELVTHYFDGSVCGLNHTHFIALLVAGYTNLKETLVSLQTRRNILDLQAIELQNQLESLNVRINQLINP